MKENFTVSYLNSLPNAEKGKRYVVYDKKIPQLSVRVTDAGTKSFLIQKRQGSSILKITLGKFPQMTIDQARKKCLEQLSSLASGKNPNVEKRNLRKEITLGDLFKIYMERYSKIKKISWKYDEVEIPKFLSKWFGRKISDISKTNVLKLHEEITRNNGSYQANRLLERLKSMYNRAIEWGWDGINPCNGIKKNREYKRDRFVKPKEFPSFFEALQSEESAVARNYIWLSLLTGARKSNVLAMRWEDIDFELKVWKIPQTKNGDPLNVPLTEEAITILKSIEQVSEWVFPSPKDINKHFVDPKKAWHRILKKAGINDLRIHDIRRTLASYQAIAGAPLNIIGKSLGHKTSAATEIYARLTTDPVRSSMEKATQMMLSYDKKEKE